MPDVYVKLSVVKDLLRNKRGMLQRLAKRCQNCPSPLHHSLYEYMLAIEAGLKEIEKDAARRSNEAIGSTP